MRNRDSQRSTERERWHPRSVYRLLLWLFRARPGNRPMTPPFLKNRPLSEAEFQATLELYVAQRLPLKRPPPEDEPQDEPRDLAEVMPFLDLTAAKGDWNAHRLIGSAAFASKPVQQRLRKKLSAEATRGKLDRRSMLALARRKLPQAKNRFSPIEVRRIAAYRRGREFVWAFLHGEARSLAADQGDRSVANMLAQAGTLAQHYGHVGLSENEIRAGLNERDKPADRDTARRFAISEKSVKSLIGSAGYLRR